MANTKQKIAYSEAIKKLDEVLDKIENPDLPLTEVELEVKEAIKLIQQCREELKGFEEDFNKILS